MQFERKNYIYILIALVLSITAIAEEQTISSELANFTEINTSRIFRVYDASTSEILLESDALYLNHVNGGINEVKITATDTQFMHDIDMAGNNINNCGNCGGSDNLSWQNSKVNKTGNENITGNISITGGNFFGNPVTNFLNPNGSTNVEANNQGNFDTIFSNNYITGGSTLNFALFQNIGNTTSYYNAFQARRARGETYPNGTSKIYPLEKNDTIFRIIGTGWDGVQWSGTTAKIEFQASGNFSLSPFYRPVKIVFGVTGDNEYVNTKDSVVIENHNLTVYGQKSSGTGYDYVCVERLTGKQINSPTACDLI